jgi:hypothetical protein
MQPDETKNPNKSEEPSASYQKPTITIFKSFEEQEEYEIKQVLKQSPEKRLSQTSELIIHMFRFTPRKLSERQSSEKIRIIHKS